MGTARDVMHRPSMQSTVGVLSITLLLAVTQASTDLELMDTVVPQIDTQVDLDWIPMPKHVVKLAAEPSKPYFFKYTQKPAPGGFPEMMLIDHLEENRAMAFPGAQKIWVCPEYEKETITLYEQWRSKADRSVYYSWDVSNIKHYRNRGESITNFKGGDCDSACLKIVAKMIADQEIPIIPDWVPETCYPVSGESAPFPVFRPTRKLRQQMIKIQKNISALEPKIAELAAKNATKTKIQTRYKNLTSKLKALQMEAIGQLTFDPSNRSPDSSNVHFSLSFNPRAGHYQKLFKATTSYGRLMAASPGLVALYRCTPKGGVGPSMLYHEWTNTSALTEYLVSCTKFNSKWPSSEIPMEGPAVMESLDRFPESVYSRCERITRHKIFPAVQSGGMPLTQPPENPSPYYVTMVQTLLSGKFMDGRVDISRGLPQTASRPGNLGVWFCDSMGDYKDSIQGDHDLGRTQVFEKWNSPADLAAYGAWRFKTENITHETRTLLQVLSMPIFIHQVSRIPDWVRFKCKKEVPKPL